jgi:hypothetical protein
VSIFFKNLRIKDFLQRVFHSREYPNLTYLHFYCFCNNGCSLNVEIYYVHFLENMHNISCFFRGKKMNIQNVSYLAILSINLLSRGLLLAMVTSPNAYTILKRDVKQYTIVFLSFFPLFKHSTLLSLGI